MGDCLRELNFNIPRFWPTLQTPHTANQAALGVSTVVLGALMIQEWDDLRAELFHSPIESDTHPTTLLNHLI